MRVRPAGARLTTRMVCRPGETTARRTMVWLMEELEQVSTVPLLSRYTAALPDRRPSPSGASVNTGQYTLGLVLSGTPRFSSRAVSAAGYESPAPWPER